jgi:transcriptional regulator with GAF, ATPase, and Fis domain
VLDFGRALPDTVIRPRESAPEPTRETSTVYKLEELAELERNNIRKALEAARGRIYGQGGAAELLGMNPSTLRSRMKTLGIKKS